MFTDARRVQLLRRILSGWKQVALELTPEDCERMERVLRFFISSKLQIGWQGWWQAITRIRLQRETLRKAMLRLATINDEALARRAFLAWKERLGADERIALIWASQHGMRFERRLEDCFNEWASLTQVLRTDTSIAVHSAIAELDASPKSINFKGVTSPSKGISDAYTQSVASPSPGKTTMLCMMLFT